jgi:hypothetical protein
MASLDNQTMQSGTETTQAPDSSDTSVRNVTGYIHFNKDDDLSKIFNILHEFRKNYGLKYSHHKDFIFFSVRSDCLSELAKAQPFRISHYRTKSEYSCSSELADKLLSVRDSFVRMSWTKTDKKTSEDTESKESVDTADGTVQFLSRTIGRVHNQLVYRIFKSISEEFYRSNYHFVRTPHQTEQTEQSEQTEQTEQTEKTEQTGQTGQTGRKRGVNSRGHRQSDTNVSADGFTKVTRGKGKSKSKYNKNKVQVVYESSNSTHPPRTPRVRGASSKYPTNKPTYASVSSSGTGSKSASSAPPSA